MKQPPRSLFRNREAVRAAQQKPLVKFRRGCLYHAKVWHDPSCRRPYGGRCSCKPDVTVEPLVDPASN